MNQPDVTVVIPVFNTMPYLTATLDSLVRQSIGHDRLHVVAVDDGSTDGSGAELDRYAATYPGLFTVIHQQNSGGPAGPCNVGLAAAEGRYVFFLGADDYFADEALERLVDRADAWGSDVLCARIVGEGGRWVNQVLYAQDAEDVPFPSALLASALSNTKLFRRSLLVEHQITFSRDLAVGSDQPFTIEAMLHARRISAVGDYDYYHAVKRSDGSNITYSSNWRARFAGIAAVVRHVADLIEPGPGRDLLLGRHFSGELATLLRVDFAEVDEQEQAELAAAVGGLADEFLTPDMEARLRVPARLRYRHARAGALEELRTLIGAHERPWPIRITASTALIAYPGYGELPESEFLATDDRIRLHLRAAAGALRIEQRPGGVRLVVPLDLLPGSEPSARFLLDSGARPATYADGVLWVDLAAGEPAPAAVQVEFALGERTWEIPVSAPDRGTPGLKRIGRIPRAVVHRLRARLGRRR